MTESTEIALVLTGTLPEIAGNFDDCKKFYLAKVAEYDLAVVPEKLAEAKKDLATLRAEAKRLDRIRIDEANRLKAPITAMEAKVKELSGIVLAAADKIDKQVKACEETARKACLDLMTLHLNATYDSLEVAAEYRNGHAMLPELVGISKLTSKGELTKAARESVEGLAQQARIAQDRVELRHTIIKSESLAAGLATPLNPEIMARWMGESDGAFRDNLARIINIELEREAKAREAIIKAEQEKIRREEQAKAQAEAEAKLAEQRKADEEKRKAEEVERQAKAKAEAEAEAHRIADRPAVIKAIVEREAIENTRPAPAPRQTPETEPEKKTVVLVVRVSLMVGANESPDEMTEDIFVKLAAAVSQIDGQINIESVEVEA
jgi:cob(I)alamin adenosyltransferase